jgi:hypothetical protein
MELDATFQLFHFQPQPEEQLHQVSPDDVEVSLVEGSEFLLEVIRGGDSRHIIHKKPVEDEVIPVPFHEHSLLAVDSGISVHPEI